jgi:hypothetical protein
VSEREAKAPHALALTSPTSFGAIVIEQKQRSMCASICLKYFRKS